MSSRVADPVAPPKRAAWWTTLTGQVVLLYAVTRVVSGIMLAATAPQQLPAPMTGGEPVGYLGFTAIWDGEWYQRIAEYGYPSTLPTDAAGGVRQNQWAFYPLFPMAARLLMWLTGLPFAFVGSTLGPAARVCGRRRHGPPACRADRGPRGPRGRRPVCRVPGGAGPAGRLHRVAGHAAAVRLPAGPLARAVAGRDRPGAAHRADATDRGAAGGGHAGRRLAALAPPGH